MAQEMPQLFSKVHLPPVSKGARFSLVETFILIAVVGLFYWFVVTPKMSEVSSKQSALTVAEEELKKVDAEKKVLEELVVKLNKQQDEIQKLDEALPFKGKNSILELIITKFAQDSGVNLNNFNFAAESDFIAAGDLELLKDPYKPKRSLKKMTGAVMVTGQLAQIKTFLNKIETSGRIFEIISMDISAGLQDEMVVSIALNSYYFAP